MSSIHGAAELLQADLEIVSAATERLKASVKLLQPREERDLVEARCSTACSALDVLEKRWKNTSSMTPVTPAVRDATAKRIQRLSVNQVDETLQLHGAFEELNRLAKSVTVSSEDIARGLHGKSAEHTGSSRRPSEVVVGAAQAMLPFEPFAPVRIVWLAIGLTAIFFDTLTLPVFIAWDLDTAPLYIPNTIASFYWLADIPATFVTAFYRNGVLVKSYRRIAKQYATTWLAFDVALVVIDLFVAFNEPGQASIVISRVPRTLRTLRILRWIRLARMFKVSALLEFFDEVIGYGASQTFEVGLTVGKVFLVIVIVAHMEGSIFFLIAKSCNEAYLPSWLTKYEMENDPILDQYLLCLQWVLGQFTPSPMDVQPQNVFERLWTILVILMGVMLTGACISRVSSSLNVIFKATADTDSAARDMRKFLDNHCTSSLLNARIMHCAMDKLKKRERANAVLDKTLVSSQLLAEFYMHTRGPALVEHVTFAFVKTAFPEFFSRLCESMSMTSHSDGDDIFVLDTSSPGLYITAPGTYEKGGDQSYYHSHKFFSELSLYMPFAHTFTLRSCCKVDIFMLSFKQLADCIRAFPKCCQFWCQYARKVLITVGEARDAFDSELSDDFCLACCAATDVYELYSLGFSLRATIAIRFTDKDCPSQEQVQNILRELTRSDGTELVSAFENVFPELCPESGTFVHYREDGKLNRRKALATMVSSTFLVNDRYDDFVQCQIESKRLTKTTWNTLQSFISWVGIKSDTRKLQAMMVFLMIRDLARVKLLTMQLPEDQQQIDVAACYIIKELPQHVPSFAALDKDMQELVLTMFRLSQDFAFGQFLQAECSPVAVAKLSALSLHSLKANSSSTLHLFLFAALGTMCGLIPTQPGKGSTFMDEGSAQGVMQALLALKNMHESSPQAVYWDYLGQRANYLGLPTECDTDVAFVKLACLCRVQTNDDLEDLTHTWMALGTSDRNIIVNCFLADVTKEKSLLFKFLPACFANAKKNDALGFAPMLILLADLMDSCLCQVQLYEGASELVVDLSDLASFAIAVKDAGVFESCLSRARLELRTNRLFLNLTSGNWDHISSEDMLKISNRLRELRGRLRSIQLESQQKHLPAPQTDADDERVLKERL